MQEFKVLRLDITEYNTALDIQLELVEKRKTDLIPDILLLLEHPPTLTVGRRGNQQNLLVSEEYLAQKGIHFKEISRGGDITFHGPGQLVGYPIMDLKYLNKDVHLYLRLIEEFLIYFLYGYGIRAKRYKGVTGVWTEGRKIASIGIGVKRWVTYHGFALNVNNDLSFFDLIIPCGLYNVQMTSMEKETGSGDININTIQDEIINNFARTFNRDYSGVLEI